MSNKDSKRWATPAEVAKHLQVEESTVKQWAKLGTIPHGKAGSMLRFDLAEIDEWVRSRGRPVAEEGAAVSP
jgi:excisionase family DNA binding protein